MTLEHVFVEPDQSRVLMHIFKSGWTNAADISTASGESPRHINLAIARLHSEDLLEHGPLGLFRLKTPAHWKLTRYGFLAPAIMDLTSDFVGSSYGAPWTIFYVDSLHRTNDVEADILLKYAQLLRLVAGSSNFGARQDRAFAFMVGLPPLLGRFDGNEVAEGILDWSQKRTDQSVHDPNVLSEVDELERFVNGCATFAERHLLTSLERWPRQKRGGRFSRLMDEKPADGNWYPQNGWACYEISLLSQAAFALRHGHLPGFDQRNHEPSDPWIPKLSTDRLAKHVGLEVVRVIRKLQIEPARFLLQAGDVRLPATLTRPQAENVILRLIETAARENAWHERYPHEDRAGISESRPPEWQKILEAWHLQPDR